MRQLEAVADGPRVARPLGRLLAGEGRDVRPHRHPGGAVVRRRGRRQAAARLNCIAHLLSMIPYKVRAFACRLKLPPHQAVEGLMCALIDRQ